MSTKKDTHTAKINHDLGPALQFFSLAEVSIIIGTPGHRSISGTISRKAAAVGPGHSSGRRPCA